jgi:hypothetical protein
MGANEMPKDVDGDYADFGVSIDHVEDAAEEELIEDAVVAEVAALEAEDVSDSDEWETIQTDGVVRRVRKQKKSK